MNRWILGLTGGIGSGKTAASRWFEQQGITVIDSDIVAREIVAPQSPALAQIKTQFGDEYLLDNGELNRKKLREFIFKSEENRKQLEAITHPLIRQSTVNQLAAAQSSYVILASPLLFESGQNDLVNRVLVIDAPEETQRNRASQRDNMSLEHIEQIMQSQMKRQQRLALATDVVHNQGSLSDLQAQLAPLHQLYLKLAQQV